MRCTLRYRLRRHSMMLLLLRPGSRHQYGGRVAGGWMRRRECSLTVPTLGIASRGKLSRAPMISMCGVAAGEGGCSGEEHTPAAPCAVFKSPWSVAAAALGLAEAKDDVPPFPMWQSTRIRRINPPYASYTTTASVDIVSLIHIFSPDLMSHCVRSSIARKVVQSSKRITFPSINRSFTNASPKMDPVSAGLNSVPITNGENKPALRFADVRLSPPLHQYLH